MFLVISFTRTQAPAWPLPKHFTGVAFPVKNPTNLSLMALNRDGMIPWIQSLPAASLNPSSQEEQHLIHSHSHQRTKLSPWNGEVHLNLVSADATS